MGLFKSLLRVSIIPIRHITHPPWRLKGHGRVGYFYCFFRHSFESSPSSGSVHCRLKRFKGIAFSVALCLSLSSSLSPVRSLALSVLVSVCLCVCVALWLSLAPSSPLCLFVCPSLSRSPVRCSAAPDIFGTARIDRMSISLSRTVYRASSDFLSPTHLTFPVRQNQILPAPPPELSVSIGS